MIRKTDGNKERLYLSKKKKEIIYIENCKIPQHHIDGIRFLYRQYKKKKPGVIINDTTGYGKNLQIVLFLKAMSMCQLLEQPVLILCQEGAEHGWMEQFQTWTDLCDEVVLENKKPHIKKQILINTMSNLSTFCGRNWSVLVVDVPELDKASLQIFGMPFKTDYKIWVTPSSMKENLDDFSRIYKWFYPKGEFDKKEFMPDNNNPCDVVNKAILLDAFMENVVARIEETHTAVENNQIEDSPPRRISLKNKDATGTKIKRSKRKIYDDDDDIPLSKTITNITIQTDKAKNTNNQNEDKNSLNSSEVTEDFCIDNFKRNSKEFIDISNNEGSDTDAKIDTANTQSQMNLFYEPDSSTDDRLYEMDTIVFGNDTCDEQSANVNEPANDIIEAATLGHKDDLSKETNLDSDNENCTDIDEDSQNSKQKQFLIDENEIVETNINEDKSDRESLSICDDITPINDNKDIVLNEVDLKPNENELNEDKNSVASPFKRRYTDMENKMKEMEEKVLKKFKGSLLDTLF